MIVSYLNEFNHTHKTHRDYLGCTVWNKLNQSVTVQVQVVYFTVKIIMQSWTSLKYS